MVPVEGMSPFVTPNADFYRIDTALAVPQVTAESWQLKVHGMVDRELEIDFDDLLQPAVDRARHHAHVRVERSRRQAHRQRAAGSACRSPTCSRRPACTPAPIS